MTLSYETSGFNPQNGSSEDMAVAENLRYVFKGSAAQALDGISFRLPCGTLLGVAGPDGAGKSTLLRLLAGLIVPTGGRLVVGGIDAAGAEGSFSQIIGYMPQKFGLYEDLTVVENLRLYAALHNLPKKDGAVRFEALLRFTDLEAFKDRLAGRLSGGMKQKLGLACALISTPRLLILDEPTVGVDPHSRRELWAIVQRLLADGITVVWSTSYLDEAARCRYVLLMNEGKILQAGPPEDFLEALRGRLWYVEDLAAERRRPFLAKMLPAPSVMDGVIEARAVRLLLREGSSPPKGGEGRWKEAPPRFEDAFVDRLGGMSLHHSALAERMAPKEPSAIPIVEARGLGKRFGAFTAVVDNSFQIPRGEIFGLLGPNGAGKSTTFKMMCGLLRPTEGTASVAGYNLEKAPSEARARIGYMAQKFSLYDQLTVAQNLRFFAGLYGLDGAARKVKIDLMIELFNFSPLLGRTAASLPLGFKQRLALATAVMHEPDVLFLDEPTSGIDPLSRREFWLHINGMVAKGVTVMVTTHFMDEAEYCDRIGLIYRGRTIAVGAPEALKKEATSETLPRPSLEDAFLELVRRAQEAAP